jgi:UPF0755 protein
MKKFLIAVLMLLALGAAGAGWYLYEILWAPAVPSNLAQTDFIIHRGMTVGQIADSLHRQSFIVDPERFLLAARLSGWSAELKAGKYRLAPETSHLDLLRMFRAGRALQQKVTLPEGKTAEDYAEILHGKLSLDRAAFLALVEDSTYARTLGLEAPRLEGYLFPNTYQFLWGASPSEVISTLVGEFHRHIDDPMRRRLEASGMSLHEVVTLAAIVEGEAVVDSERTVIAAVYRNRLARGMLLQADPTIQYIVPGPPRRLLLRDLEIDSPYNTYRYAGLPPGPVNNPGIKSMRAVLEPAPVGYLYFVARGDGSHIFSYTLEQHLAAKRAFDRVRARVRREQLEASKSGAGRAEN